MNYKNYKKWLTKAECDAIEYIGLHRKTETLAGKHISKRIYNQLKKKHLIMDMYKSERMKYARVMLTYHGEKVFTQMHPYSKYRIR